MKTRCRKCKVLFYFGGEAEREFLGQVLSVPRHCRVDSVHLLKLAGFFRAIEKFKNTAPNQPEFGVFENLGGFWLWSAGSVFAVE